MRAQLIRRLAEYESFCSKLTVWHHRWNRRSHETGDENGEILLYHTGDFRAHGLGAKNDFLRKCWFDRPKEALVKPAPRGRGLACQSGAPGESSEWRQLTSGTTTDFAGGGDFFETTTVSEASHEIFPEGVSPWALLRRTGRKNCPNFSKFSLLLFFGFVSVSVSLPCTGLVIKSVPNRASD